MDTSKKTKRPAHPRASANPLSAFFFIWVVKIFTKGMKKEMEIEDLFEPLDEHRSSYLGDYFERGWNEELCGRRNPDRQESHRVFDAGIATLGEEVHSVFGKPPLHLRAHGASRGFRPLAPPPFFDAVRNISNKQPHSAIDWEEYAAHLQLRNTRMFCQPPAVPPSSPQTTSLRRRAFPILAWRRELADEKHPSLMRVIVKRFFWEYMFYSIPIIFLELVFRVAQPMFLGSLIKYFEPGSEVTLQTAYLSAFGLLGCSASFILIRQSNMMVILHMGMKMRVGVCSLIYRKSLRLTHTALGETTVGQVVNLLSNDVSRFDLCLIYLPYFTLGPLQAIIVTYFMWDAMGISTVIGVVMTLSFIPLQAFIGKKIAGLRLRCALRTDERVRLMNEIISGIQVIKQYTWEIPFSKLVAHARLNEIHEIRLVSYLRAIMLSFESFTTRLTLFITVLCYVLLGNVLTADKVFVVSSFFNILRNSMTDFLPRGIFMVAETIVSIRRIEKFLLYEELETLEMSIIQGSGYGLVALNDKIHTDIKQAKDEEGTDGSVDQLGVVMSGATAKWTPESGENTLTDISVRVSTGQLLGVIGPVGSGKTSLLLTLLRELPLTSGSIVVKGRISYASQEPWLFASSVRNNILFGEQYDRQRYRQVVKVCALTRDFELLPYGDKTVVGERGVSLSGGQRARINLARAVYKQADVYILDDPLSAVDTHVGKHLFENCICGFMRSKIRILVTHQLQFLSQVDHIVIMNEGRVEARGTYGQLLESGLNFAKLLGDQEGDESEEKIVASESGEDSSSTALHRRRSRGVSIGSSASSMEMTSAEKMTPSDVQEMRTRGKISQSTYVSYMFASRRHCLVVVLVLGSLMAQLLFSGTDYWLSFWTNLESQRGLEETAVDGAGNSTDPSRNSTHVAVQRDGSRMSRELCTYIFAGLTTGAVSFILFKTFLFFYLCMKSSINLHNKMFERLIRLPMRFFNMNPSGQILNRFSKDTGAIDEQLPLVLLDCISMSFMMLGIVTLVATVNYWILVPTLLVAVIFYLVRVVFVQTSRSLKRMEGITRSPVFSHLNASIQGLTTIRALQAQSILQEQFDSHQDLHSSAYYLYVASSRAFGLWLDIVCLSYISCVTLSFIVFGQDILGGSVGLAISQSLGLMGIFQWGMRQSAELENQMTAVERVLEYSSLENEGQLEASPDKKPAKDWPSEGRIIFKNVFLSYARDEPPVLKNLNLTIRPSEKVGVVGRTGAGKSSLIAALFRLTRIEGSILVDGVDTKSIGLHDLRSKISIIPQEPVLFSGSLRKNLDPFDQFPDTVLWSALEEVELKEVVRELPAGLNHKMLEGGSNFSIGQRQLVCLARAIIRSNKILVMDEATANVDPRTDALIQETVRQKFADCTVLTIAHRLLTIMDSDRILVMDAGNVVEFDQPHILLQNKSGFLWSMVQETGKSMAETLLKMAEKSYLEKES